MNNPEKELSFNDIPQAISRLINEVLDIKHQVAELIKRGEVKPADRHIPMGVKEASEYLKIPIDTLYDKLAKGEVPATKPFRRYVLYKDELDKWLECHRKNAVPMTPEEENEAILASNRRKPKSRKW